MVYYVKGETWGGSAASPHLEVETEGLLRQGSQCRKSGWYLLPSTEGRQIRLLSSDIRRDKKERETIKTFLSSGRILLPWLFFHLQAAVWVITESHIVYVSGSYLKRKEKKKLMGNQTSMGLIRERKNSKHALSLLLG